VPLGEARLGHIGLDEWLRVQRQKPDAASEVYPQISPAGASWMGGPRHSRKHSKRVSIVIGSAIA
jgi:hypothetical protein